MLFVDIINLFLHTNPFIWTCQERCASLQRCIRVQSARMSYANEIHICKIRAATGLLAHFVKLSVRANDCVASWRCATTICHRDEVESWRVVAIPASYWVKWTEYSTYDSDV